MQHDDKMPPIDDTPPPSIEELMVMLAATEALEENLKAFEELLSEMRDSMDVDTQ